MAPWKKIGAGSLLSPSHLHLFIQTSIYYNRNYSGFNYILLFILFLHILCSREYCQLRFASNGRTTLLHSVREKKKNYTPHICVYYTTLHIHHASLRGVHPKQFPAISSPATNSHVTAKVHRALPKAPESPSTHQDFVSGAATGPRTGHGPSQ